MEAKAPAGPLREILSRALVEHGDRLYALALRVTRDGDLAADAVQDAFAAALARADDFRGESAPATWLHRIVYNKSVDLLRQRGREESLTEDDAEALGADDPRQTQAASWSRPPDEILLGEETRRVLEDALAQLSPRQRAVFSLREMDGLTTDEAADALGLQAGAVRVALHRARMRLRALLANHFTGTKV
jgi:RNA polymerase sigma-70 factor, ECF subfamily